MDNGQWTKDCYEESDLSRHGGDSRHRLQRHANRDDTVGSVAERRHQRGYTDQDRRDLRREQETVGKSGSNAAFFVFKLHMSKKAVPLHAKRARKGKGRKNNERGGVYKIVDGVK